MKDANVLLETYHRFLKVVSKGIHLWDMDRLFQFLRNCQIAQEKCGMDLSYLSHSRMHGHGAVETAWVWALAGCRGTCLSRGPGFGPQPHSRERLNHRKQKGPQPGFQGELLGEASHLGLHAGAPLFLLLPFPHVLILLFRFCHGLKKLIKNPKEFIWLYFASLFPKVLHCFSELEKKI